jgi:hypothetical protein
MLELNSEKGSMPPIATAVIGLSLLLLFCWIAWRNLVSLHWPSLLLGLVGIGLYVVLLRLLFGFPSLTVEESKGSQDNAFLAQVVAMYLFMLAGMAAEYLYHYLDSQSAKDRSFEIGTFIKPFLVSPLVFMPLAASLQNANLDLSRFDGPRLMVFLVAFENGFLWRGYFTRKMGAAGRATPKKKEPQA